MAPSSIQTRPTAAVTLALFQALAARRSLAVRPVDHVIQEHDLESHSGVASVRTLEQVQGTFALPAKAAFGGQGTFALPAKAAFGGQVLLERNQALKHQRTSKRQASNCKVGGAENQVALFLYSVEGKQLKGLLMKDWCASDEAASLSRGAAAVGKEACEAAADDLQAPDKDGADHEVMGTQWVDMYSRSQGWETALISGLKATMDTWCASEGYGALIADFVSAGQAVPADQLADCREQCLLAHKPEAAASMTAPVSVDAPGDEAGEPCALDETMQAQMFLASSPTGKTVVLQKMHEWCESPDYLAYLQTVPAEAMGVDMRDAAVQRECSAQCLEGANDGGETGHLCGYYETRTLFTSFNPKWQEYVLGGSLKPTMNPWCDTDEYAQVLGEMYGFNNLPAPTGALLNNCRTKCKEGPVASH